MNAASLKASIRSLGAAWAVAPRAARTPIATRSFHRPCPLHVLKPFLLADIGEGIREVQIIQWFVQPGARVAQFDKLCEVQSDKASVEITSRYDGVIKKLHYEADDMATVGKPLVDIDIENDMEEDEGEAGSSEAAEQQEQQSADSAESQEQSSAKTQEQTQEQLAEQKRTGPPSEEPFVAPSKKTATLATPAVRRLTKELNVDITEIPGTGKDGRVLKEDVQRFADGKTTPSATTPETQQPSAVFEDRTVNLSPMQSQMFKTMTRSLNIPHFLYSDTFDTGAVTNLRRKLNASSDQKLSLLPFIIKAASLAITDYPILNARLDTSTNPEKPQLVLRGAHNIGIAVDTPQGLLVPVIKGVQNLSVADIAAEAKRLSSLAREGKLAADDMKGGTFSVSNVGSIGGGVVAPVIVESQVAIVGVGKTKVVPAFDDEGNVIAREECTLSWSADHRILDGATVARCAAIVKDLLEEPGTMLVRMK